MVKMSKLAGRSGAVILTVLLPVGLGRGADETYRLQERFPVGYQYHVRMRVDVSGSLTPPPMKGKESKAVTVRGSSAIDYDERILEHDEKGAVKKTIDRK